MMKAQQQFPRARGAPRSALAGRKPTGHPFNAADGRNQPLINVDQSFVLVTDLQKQLGRFRGNSNDSGASGKVQSSAGSLPPADLKLARSGDLREDKAILNVKIDPDGLGQDLVNMQESVHEIDKAGASGGAVRYDHSPNPHEGTENQAQPRELEEKDKWKVVMKFMKSNPQVILEMMPPAVGPSTADDIQNLLYNSSSKQYLTSKGYLRYQNNEAMGGVGGRNTSYDSNRSPSELEGAGIGGLSHEQLPQYVSRDVGNNLYKPYRASQRAKSSFMRSQNTSHPQVSRDFRISTHGTATRPATSTRQISGVRKRQVAMHGQLGPSARPELGPGSALMMVHPARPSTTVGLVRSGAALARNP